MKEKHFVAFDLGASSGRSILGTVSEGKLTMKELTRFHYNMIVLDGHYYWNIFSLYEHLKAGLTAAAKEGVEISSIGIDTWGVDFACVGADGTLLGMPHAYRDPFTTEAPEQYFNRMIPRREVYEITGIQVMNFNSIYQLYAMRRDKSSQLAAAKYLLFIPDALNYLLTGKMATEYTIASTSQLLDARTKKMNGKLLASLGLDKSVFPEMVMPGHTVGMLKEEIAAETGMKRVPVVAVAGHDTGSAVAAVPARNEHFAYLSSGTWSLMGIEVKEPVINHKTFDFNITNEGGVEGTIRLLKNIAGMWLAEQCLKEWKREGREYSYPEMVAMAQAAPTFKAFVDPDDPSFANPASMPAAIDIFCKRTGQTPPANHGEYIRLIFDSLALKYRKVFEMFLSLSPFPIERMHIIGGGSRNKLLNQFTANSLGIDVVAGPAEATAIGNIMVQARAAGLADSLQQMRDMIAAGIETETFTPADREAWNAAYTKFIQIIK